MEIVITDMSGKRISSRSLSLVAGSNQFVLDFTNLASGTYQVSGYTADGVKTLRFIKD